MGTLGYVSNAFFCRFLYLYCMHIRLQQIWHAVELAEAGSYTLAARRVHLSQPALSRSIKRLESELKAVLFDRTAEGVVPTTIGALLIQRGAALLRASRDMQREVELTLGLETGQLHVGAGTYPANLSVGEACGRLIAAHPGLRLEVRVGDWPELVEEVLEGKLDIAVAETTAIAGDERLAIEPLPSHRGHFICRNGHPLTAAKSLTLADISPFPLVTTSLPARFEGLAPTVRVDTFDLLHSVVRYSDAIGLAVDIQIDSGGNAGRLRKLPLDMPYLHTRYGFVRLQTRTPSPAAIAFMAQLREVEAGLAQRPGGRRKSRSSAN
jgi:DNA-binding transcriptional LysR family regulator